MSSNRRAFLQAAGLSGLAIAGLTSQQAQARPQDKPPAGKPTQF